MGAPTRTSAMTRVGLGVVTYNRPHFFARTAEAIIKSGVAGSLTYSSSRTTTPDPAHGHAYGEAYH